MLRNTALEAVATVVFRVGDGGSRFPRYV